MTTKDITRVYLGNTEVTKLYLGDIQVYPNNRVYVSTYDLNLGTPSTTLTIPFNSELRYQDLRIDWGDGNTTVGTNTHTYSELGIYEIKMYGAFSGIRHGQDENTAIKLINISDWGDIGLINEQYKNCINLEITAENNSVRSTANWQQETFKNCKKITAGPSVISNGVTNAYGMYDGCDLLTTIGTTNFPNVTNMSNFIKDCPLLDVDLSYMCVPLIESLPANFSTGSPLMTPDKFPVWGTCP